MKAIRIVVAVSTLSASSLVFAGNPAPEKPGVIRRIFQRLTGSAREAETSTKAVSLVVRPQAAPEKLAGIPKTMEHEAAPVRATVTVHTTAEEPKRTTTKPAAPSSYKSLYESGPRSYDWEKPVRAKAAYEKLPDAARAPIDALFKQVGRPTLAQLRATMRAAYGDKQPAENPFGSASHVKGESFLIADMVAQLEHAFPGGQWLPLGRDAVLIADALDGFYGAIGQQGRVRRLDMSGLSLPHYRDANPDTFESDRPMIYGFLKANGLDLANAKQKAPYVMIDVTSYSPTSQSTQLMRSTYRTWVKEFGGDPKDLYDRVNFVGTPMGGASHFISDSKDIDGVKDRLRDRTGTDGPKEILYLGGNMHKLTYTSAWHRDFTKMYKQADGSVTADAGHPGSEDSKREVLAELFEVDALTKSPAFLAQVRKIAADKYGYEFPMQQTERVTRIAGAAASKTKIAGSASKGEIVGDGESTDTGYMRSLRMRLPNAANKPEVAVEFVRDLAGMWARQSVSKAQAKAALREIQSHVNLRSSKLDAELASVYSQFPGFQAVVDRALRKL